MLAARTENQTKAIAAKVAAVGLLRELFRLKGSEASEEATMLEMLSGAVIVGR